MQVITITTDAGYYFKDKIGTYAFRIRGNDFFYKGNGVFKELEINGSTCAEKGAVKVALWILKQHKQDFDLLVINRDNIHVNHKTIKAPIQSLKKALKKLYGPKIRTIDFRHIKAHSGTKEKRTYVHNRCDKACKNAYKNFKSKYIKNN